MNSFESAVAQFNYPQDKDQEAEKLRQQFLSRFPVSKLPTLTLKEYALGLEPKENSFCYWLEFETRMLGSMRGGTAYKHIVFFRKKKNKWEYDPKFPNENVAFESARNGLVTLISLAEAGTFTEETMSAIVQKAGGQERVLYSLLAGSGLRVGEVFGLEIKHLSPDCRTVTVEQSCWEGDLQTTKTKNAYRQVDPCTPLADLLKAFNGDRESGLLFSNRSGKPLSQTNVVRRSLHPILKELGVEQTGFHAMRRFRTTWLRKQQTPEDLIKFWLAHSKPESLN
jgi:integrase